MVESGDVVPNNESLKIKWRFKASEDEDETIREDSHLCVKTIRMFSAITVTSLGTMIQIVGTKLKSKPIYPKQQTMWVTILLFFLFIMIQVFRMILDTLTRVLATTCARRKKLFMKLTERVHENVSLRVLKLECFFKTPDQRLKSIKRRISPSSFPMFTIFLT